MTPLVGDRVAVGARVEAEVDGRLVAGQVIGARRCGPLHELRLRTPEGRELTVTACAPAPGPMFAGGIEDSLRWATALAEALFAGRDPRLPVGTQLLTLAGAVLALHELRAGDAQRAQARAAGVPRAQQDPRAGEDPAP